MALRNAEAVAAAVARPMLILARLASPVVWFLDLSSRLILRAVGGRQVPDSSITEDEIKQMIAEAESAGLVEPAEKRMIAAVMRLGDQPARAVMTPRREVIWIDLEDDEAEILKTIRASTYSRLLVSRKVIDEVVGVVQAKDLLDAFLDGAPFAVETHVRPALVVPDGAHALQVIDILRQSPAHMAIVVDEYGGFQGIVTPADILETIVGGFDDASGLQQEAPVRRDDGSWLLDGWMSSEEMSDLLGLALPAERDFHTVGGFVLARLRQVPTTGDRFDWGGWRFEVVDMDGRRVDKVLAARVVTLHGR
jgi:putative hemolysin